MLTVCFLKNPADTSGSIGPSVLKILVLYRAVSQFFAAFENNSNFGQKVLTGTDFRSKFVKMALSHKFTVFRSHW